MKTLNALGLGLSLLIAGGSLAGCGGSVDPASTKNDLTTGQPDPEPSCPEVTVPMCAADTSLVTRVDAKTGCPAYECVGIGADGGPGPDDVGPSCPPVATPICAAGTELVFYTDPNGCSFATCQAIGPNDGGPGPDGGPYPDGGPWPDSGPDLDGGPGPDVGPDLDGGPWIDSGPDFDGGPDPDAGPSCPPVATPICAAGTTLVYYVDSISGCAYAVCEAR